MGLKIENEFIKNSLQEKFLVTVTDNKLTFKPHVENFRKKTGQKLHALATIANYKDISKNTAL